MKIRITLALLLLLSVPATVLAETTFQPFILASINDNKLEDQTQVTIDSLERSGFVVVGQYTPLDNARVIVVTSDNLKAVAAQTDRGGYGAAQRISVTERDGTTEVAFINPRYIQHAYRLESDMQSVYDQLSTALGTVEPFGASKKMTAKKLEKYHYMMGMQRFDDPSQLGQFDSYSAAIEAVESGLAVTGDALTLVYRIDIPGKDQTVFGVGMKATDDSEKEMDIDEAHQLAIVDYEGYSKVAYLPYEVLVTDNEVEALHMRFRMAVHFPDLSMMGKHGFTKLMSSPRAIEDALKNMVEADKPDGD